MHETPYDYDTTILIATLNSKHLLTNNGREISTHIAWHAALRIRIIRRG